MKPSMTMTLLVASLGIGGCANHLYDGLPRHDAAYRIAPPIDAAAQPAEYVISPGDELAFGVVGEPDLTVARVIVDDAGKIQVPLVGTVQVGGHSAAEASKTIETQLGARYIKDPKVVLNVTTPTPKLVSVEGQVTKAGAYPVSPGTSLLSAIAMAESTSKTARLDEIVVFRTRNGQRMAARFDLERIRAGLDPDPQILGGDTVVVGFSSAKAVYRDFLSAAPFFNIFTKF